jgi:hypothetical protein
MSAGNGDSIRNKDDLPHPLVQNIAITLEKSSII